MNDTTRHPEDTAKITRSATERASGRFLLRIDPGLHAALRRAAAEAGLSLNDYCARKLASPSAGVAGPAFLVVLRAASLIGVNLEGIVAFGSWTRGEQREGSDVDVLVAVRAEVEITRALYRAWDAEEPLTWEGLPLEPHFVCVPEEGARISGLWAEAAVDGIVLFDPSFRLSRRLVEIRRRIASGEVIRRYAHGQPYWVGAA